MNDANLDVTEQLARIEREHAHARQLQAEAALKGQHLQFGYLEPRRFWVSAVTAAAALLGAVEREAEIIDLLQREGEMIQEFRSDLAALRGPAMATESDWDLKLDKVNLELIKLQGEIRIAKFLALARRTTIQGILGALVSAFARFALTLFILTQGRTL
jgi:hypothetical protein